MTVQNSLDQLRLWVSPGNAPAYEVDLTEFALGGRRENLLTRLQAGWVGDYEGRPRFATQFATYHRLAAPSTRFSANARAAIRTFFRFLDISGLDIESVEDLSDAHGALFKAWLETERNDNRSYHIAKVIIDRIRQLEGLPRLWWPARRVTDIPLSDDVDLLGLRRLFNALKGDARAIKAMFAEGTRLANSGRDPRGEAASRGFAPASWERRENHAWLVRELTTISVLDKAAIYSRGGSGLNKANDPSQLHSGPEYCVSACKFDPVRRGIGIQL